MPRRKRLKSVAASVLVSFVSRNNDLEGYWALGKLYAHVLSHSTDTFEFDLLTGQLTPDDGELVAMAFSYSAMFQRLLRGQKMPGGRVRAARLRIQFDVDVEQAHYPLQACSKPFKAVLATADQDGTEYSVEAFGWCRPHDPRIETRRGG